MEPISEALAISSPEVTTKELASLAESSDLSWLAKTVSSLVVACSAYPTSMFILAVLGVSFAAPRIYTKVVQSQVRSASDAQHFSSQVPYSAFYFNSALDNSTIIDTIVSDALSDDNEVILKFYVTEDPHGSIVCKTERHTFECHLVGVPGSLIVELRQAKWDPIDICEIKTATETTLGTLKTFIKTTLVKEFGQYHHQTNNCVDCARRISQFIVGLDDLKNK